MALYRRMLPQGKGDSQTIADRWTEDIRILKNDQQMPDFPMETV